MKDRLPFSTQPNGSAASKHGAYVALYQLPDCREWSLGNILGSYYAMQALGEEYGIIVLRWNNVSSHYHHNDGHHHMECDYNRFFNNLPLIFIPHQLSSQFNWTDLEERMSQ